MKTTANLHLLLVAVLLAVAADRSKAQGDNFDDGDDAGWMRIAPLQMFGVETTFSFPDGAYRIQCAPNAVNDTLGPPRAGALREDVSYTDFYLSVDIFTDSITDQNVGFLARVSDAGLGTLDGYGITYNRQESRMFLTAITDEEGDNFADADVFNPPDGVGVRMVFQGTGNSFRADLYALDDLDNPIGTVVGEDSTYASGICGIFHVSDPLDAATDSTFDNYVALPGVVTDIEIVDVRVEDDQLQIEFTSAPNARYVLYEAGLDGVWVEKDDSVIGALAETTVTQVPMEQGATRLYRLEAAAD